MKMILSLLICAIGMCSNAQIRVGFSAGSINAKGKYGHDWQDALSVTAKWGLALNAWIETPVAKRLTFYNAIEIARKRLSYATPAIPDFSLERAEACSYLSLKPALHFLIVKRNGFSIAAGPGLFGSIAIKGKYTEAGTSFGGVYRGEGNLRIGNSSGNSYKTTDAGISLQSLLRYKNFTLPLMADWSLVNNIPGKDAMVRKWHSFYAGIGYSFIIKTKSKA